MWVWAFAGSASTDANGGIAVAAGGEPDSLFIAKFRHLRLVTQHLNLALCNAGFARGYRIPPDRDGTSSFAT